MRKLALLSSVVVSVVAIILIGIYVNYESLVDSGENYAVFRKSSSNYRYVIYNSENKVVYKESVNKEPIIKYLNGNILFIHITIGTGTSVNCFYDIEQNKLSEVYPSLSFIQNGLIVYAGYDTSEIVLVIRDIFDKGVLYQTYRRDFSPVANPFDVITSVKYINKNTFEVTYLSGSNYDEKVEELQLVNDEKEINA